jgi:hypothetical protein
LKKANLITLIGLLVFTNLWATPEQTQSSEGIYIANPNTFFAVENTVAINNTLVNAFTSVLTVFDSTPPPHANHLNKRNNLKKAVKQLATAVAKTQKQKYNFKAVPIGIPSSNCSALAQANKLSTTPNLLNHWAVVVVFETKNQKPTTKNYQPKTKTYSNPTLGLALQNSTPVYNKPPPFI